MQSFTRFVLAALFVLLLTDFSTAQDATLKTLRTESQRSIKKDPDTSKKPGGEAGYTASTYLRAH